MKMQKISAALFAIILTGLMALPLCSQPFTPPGVFTNQQDGTIIYAATWNSAIGGLYTYITYTLLPQLNCLTTQGDLYVYSGSVLNRLGIGSNGQVLTSDNTKPNGLAWEAGAGLPITTKGDIIVGNGSGVATRLAAGPNGQVLTANSAATNGINWAAVASLNAPPGAIIMYNPIYGGGIPAGWVICDGTNSTPNLIGMFVIGGQPSGGSSTPNINGYGNTTYGTTYGSIVVSGTVNVSGTTAASNNNASVIQGSGSLSSPLATSSHTHTVNSNGSINLTNQNACYSVVFIMKT